MEARIDIDFKVQGCTEIMSCEYYITIYIFVVACDVLDFC